MKKPDKCKLYLVLEDGTEKELAPGPEGIHQAVLDLMRPNHGSRVLVDVPEGTYPEEENEKA